MDYDAALSEICKRAKQVPGGTCGYWGVCGAAAGAGIFMSVMTGSSPLHKDAWPFPQKLVSIILSQTGRCWWTSLLQTNQQNCH